MYHLNTAASGGRTTPANDNRDPVGRADQIRALRLQGRTFRDIADILNINVSTAHRAVMPRAPKRPPLAANDNKIVRDIPFNGGWSTNSGMAKVSLPRMPTLERAEIAPELAVAPERIAA